MEQRYILEISVQGDRHPTKVFESDKPFMPIAKDDIIISQTWDVGFTDPLRVVEISHLIWEQDGNPRHKIMIETVRQQKIGGPLS